MPEHLIWFKWESYVTWLSGFGMLALVYYAGADLYLIDPSVLDVSKPTAIAISLASLGFGWLAYDTICRSPLGNDNTRLMVLLYFILVAVAWGYTQLFTGRAAYLHLGAFTATIMSANVFFIIIPNQKKVVADLIAGRTPDPALGKQAKQRSTHNNYLTLPVLFLMLSNHYPLAFGTQYNWIIASLVFLMGVTIRHWFNTQHARKGAPTGPGWSRCSSSSSSCGFRRCPRFLPRAVRRGRPLPSRPWSQRRISRRSAIRCSAAAPCAMRASPAGRASSCRRRASSSKATATLSSMPAKSICRQGVRTPCRPPMSPASPKRNGRYWPPGTRRP